MQAVGLVALVGYGAIGFVAGVLVTVLFGKRIAAAAVADTKAVAYDAARMVNDSTSRGRAVLAAIEARIHAKIDTLKTDVSKDVEKL